MAHNVDSSITLARNDSIIKGKGSYVLLIAVAEEQTVTVGQRKATLFPPGQYAYVGSAMSGFAARLHRHRRRAKKAHWHIDYLLQRATITDIILYESTEKTECAIARALSHHFEAIPGFGASDCRCRSHLFLAAKELKPMVMTILHRLGRHPKLA